MPTDVQWYGVNETIIQIRLIENWTVEDFLSAIDTASHMASFKRKATVSVMVNVVLSAGVPQNINLIPCVWQGFQEHPFRAIAVTGGSSLSLALVRLVSRLNPTSASRIYFESDRDQAVARLDAEMKKTA